MDLTLLLVGMVLALMAVLMFGRRGEDRTVVVVPTDLGQPYRGDSGCMTAIAIIAVVFVVLVILGSPVA